MRHINFRGLVIEKEKPKLREFVKCDSEWGLKSRKAMVVIKIVEAYIYILPTLQVYTLENCSPLDVFTATSKLCDPSKRFT